MSIAMKRWGMPIATRTTSILNAFMLAAIPRVNRTRTGTRNWRTSTHIIPMFTTGTGIE